MAAAIGCPTLASFSGQMAVEEGKRFKSIGVDPLTGHGIASSPEMGGNNSESEGEHEAVKKIKNTSRSGMKFQNSSVNNSSAPLLPSVSSFKASRSKRGSHKSSPSRTTPTVPSYLPGAPIPLSNDSFVHTPRTPLTSFASARKRQLYSQDTRKYGQSQSTSELPSPTARDFEEAENSSYIHTASPNDRPSHSPKVTFRPPSRSGSQGNLSPNSPSSKSPYHSAVSSLDSLAIKADLNRHARSVPSFHASTSASSLHPGLSTASLPSFSIPPPTISAMLRSYACRSQLDLLTSLQDISTRLIVVPKMARLSALRAELTVLNHGLPRGSCLCLGCSGKGGGSLLSSFSPESSPSFLSIYSAPVHKQQHSPHHRIVRISPSEAVVLNSADRAPFLIHVEVLEDDLDFDPSRRQNAEDIRSLMAERNVSYKSRAVSNDRSREAGDTESASPRNDSRIEKDDFLSQKSPLMRTSSNRSANLDAHGNGVSEVDGALDYASQKPAETGPSSYEEVDLVEQLYGSFSVHDATTMPNPEYHPEIHNRTVDEAAWRRAEARKSLQLSAPSIQTLGSRDQPRTSFSARKALTIDEYAERMRMAAIMLSQLNASQQLPRSGTDAVTGVVGAGVGIGVNITYGVGSVVGSVMGVGFDAVRASFGSRSESAMPPIALDSSKVPAGQASSGVSASIDPTSAASGLSTVSGMTNPATLPEQTSKIGPVAPQLSPTTSASSQHPRQRVLAPSEASAIRERIMSEMMSLEEERMARMRASSRSSRNGSWAVTKEQVHPETTEEESIVMAAVNKEDPSGAVFQESWADKKSRIRKASPYGHLASWDVFSVIVKTGADLRQEQLAVQLIKEFGKIWTETNCSHWIR